MYQFLSFYQKELALWMFHNLDTKAGDVCLDTELAPAFKVQQGQGQRRWLGDRWCSGGG